MTNLSRVLVALLAVSLVATSVEAKPAGKAQSNMSAKWSRTLDGIAQNFK